MSKASGAPARRVALYARISRDDGSDISASIETQERILRDYLQSSFDEPYRLVGVFRDDGFTGTDSNRPDFQRMLALIDRGEVSCVIVKDLSRLSRDYVEAGQYVEELFVRKNVRFISLELPFYDTARNTDNSISFMFQSLINSLWPREISQKVRKVFNFKRSQGEFIGGFAPYGYAKDPQCKNRLVVDGEAAETVRDIYRWFVHGGMSKAGIARLLNEQGVLSPLAYKRSRGLNHCAPQGTDGLWSYSGVNTVLRNRMYTGDMVQGRHRIVSHKVHKQVRVPREEWFVTPGTHEAIIDRELFDRAQQLQARSTREAAARQGLHLFAGFVRCADCGRAMYRKASKGHSYYVCRTYTEKSRTACTRHSINEARLNSAVLAAINLQILLAADPDQVISQVNAQPPKPHSATRLDDALKRQRAELAKAQRVRDSLYADWRSGELTEADYRRLKEQYTRQMGQLEEKIAQLERGQAEEAGGNTALPPEYEGFLRHLRFTALTRQMLVELVDTIYVLDNGDIKIDFAFADCCPPLPETLPPGGCTSVAGPWAP